MLLGLMLLGRFVCWLRAEHNELHDVVGVDSVDALTRVQLDPRCTRVVVRCERCGRVVRVGPWMLHGHPFTWTESL